MKLRAVVASAWRNSNRSQAPRHDLAWIVLIALVAALVRLFVVVRFSGEPVWDGHYYHFGAVRLASGLGYSEDVIKQGVLVWKPWTHYPVGYSFWLSLWYRIFGSKLWVAPLSNAVVGTATVVLIYAVSRPFLGTWRARLAAALAALHPGLVLYTAVAMSEPLAACLLIASVWPLLYVRRRILAASLAGVLLGASVLVRPSSLVALPLYWFLVGGAWNATSAASRSSAAPLSS
ncbi:MAG TPA: glycosyltransferase family 39 protein, partial [Polyangiaceae bacterium]|nr:glycosyltransferase family 39 protein [Polyangiaceae bacterium]